MSTTPEFWARVKKVAGEAWDRPAGERAAYVINACGADDLLAREVLALVEAMEHAGDRLETPAVALPGAGLAVADAIASHRADLIGERISYWTVVRELGHGGMGTVYLGERTDADFTQQVAIKVVRGGAGDRVLAQRFVEERRILATLEHANIARLIDGGVTPFGLPFVVLEYVEGLPIDAYCEHHALDVRARIELFRRVCDAANYAHHRLIVHRDIKPSNVLVSPDGVPKLLDFGIAKMLETRAPQEATLVRMVTPESASPEQIRGDPITTAADVYALGVLLYRLVTGRSPYRLTSGSETDLIRAVCEQAPEPPSAGAPIDADLDRIILKALSKEPERRYAGADQFSDDLQRYLDGRPVLATPDSRLYRARKFVKRHRVSVAAAAAVAVAILGGTGATLWQARVARRERARAERQFNAVRTLAASVLGELHDAVANLPGATAANELLLRRATEYLDGLSRESGSDAALRRELAAGYRRLAEVQGDYGMSNIGDSDASRTSYRKAVALLEPLAEESREVRDVVSLARAYASLSYAETDPDARHRDNQRATALLDGVPAVERGSRELLDAEVTVWFSVGREFAAQKDYEAARAAFVKVLDFAEAGLKLKADSAAAMRNVGLACQQIGTMLEVQERRAEAIPYYRRALSIDLDRVTVLHGSAESRLDLSSSYGALATALANNGDAPGARENYSRALELRRAVLADDPENDRARFTLGYGYHTMGQILADTDDVGGAFDSEERGVAVFRERAQAHPERERPWIDYAELLVASVNDGIHLLERRAMPAATRVRFAGRIDAMLTALVDLRARWSRDGRQSSLPPDEAALRSAITKVAGMSRPGRD